MLTLVRAKSLSGQSGVSRHSIQMEVVLRLLYWGRCGHQLLHGHESEKLPICKTSGSSLTAERLRRTVPNEVESDQSYHDDEETTAMNWTMSERHVENVRILRRPFLPRIRGCV